jgi:hypothetical protein
MAVLRYYLHAELTPDGDAPLVLAGLKGKPIQVTCTGNVDPYVGSVANNAAVILWDVDNSPCTAFVWVWVQASRGCFLQFQGADIVNNSTVKIEANTPMVFTSDDMTAYAAGGGMAGTILDIKSIVLHNRSGAIANVRSYVVQ